MSATASRRGPGPGARRRELLAAARTVLAEHGYERTTVSSIATRANVAQGTFYLYFPSKEALPGALALELSAALADATDGAAAAHDALDDAVAAIVDAVFAAAAEFSDVLPICNRGIELADSFDEWLVLTQPWRDALERFLLASQERGEVERDLDVTTSAYVLRDVLDRAIKARIVFGEVGYAKATCTLVKRALATH